jgi:lipoprotein NlpD
VSRAAPGRLVATLLALMLAGCVVTRTEVVRTGAAPGAVPARPAPAAAPGSAGGHVVARGDTLYSIAFRHGVDWRSLAAWNGLAPPHTIYPGQRLRVTAPGSVAPAVAATPPAASPRSTVPPAATTPVPPTTPLPAGGVETRPIADAGAPPAASPPTSPAAPPATVPAGTVPAPGVTAVPPSTGTPPSPAAAHTRPAAAPIADAATAQVGGLRWRWPTQGEVIDRFSAGDITRQGIDIAGSSGQAVVAAADGEVVYSGSGLRGYGELVIVKHSPQFLSAYGHNRTRLVNEGERVQAGQPIAELGRTGADRDKLHFEIRRDGRPVDPLQYLPRR